MSKPSSRGKPLAVPPSELTIDLQRPVVHVHDAAPGDAARVEPQRIAPVDVVVEHRRQQIVRAGDGVEVAGEVQIDVLHRHHLGIAAAGRPALDAEAGPERGLAQAAHGLLADAVEAVAEAHRGRGLALAGGRRRDGGDEDQLAVLVLLRAVDEVEGHLGLVGAVVEQRAVGDADALSDLGDRLHGGFARNLNIRLDAHDLDLPSRERAQTVEHQLLDFGAGLSNVSPALMLVDFAQSAAAIFLPSAPRTRFARIAPPPAAMVMPLASIESTSPGLPEPEAFARVEDIDLLAFDGAPRARRGIGGADQVVDLGDGLGPIDLGHLFLEPALVGLLGVVLGDLRRLAGFDEIDRLHHGVDAERKELLEIDIAQRLVGADRHFLLQQDRPLIEPLVGPEDGKARLGAAHGDRPVDGRRPAVQRQQRGMILDGAELGRIDDRLRHEQRHIGHDAQIGVAATS